MSDAPSVSNLRDPRLASIAVSAHPAWLWSIDGTRVLWANAVGAAIFDASTPDALALHRFEATEPAAAQVARLAAALAHGAAPRLERLRGFGGAMARPLLCACQRIVLADFTSGILIAAKEAAGPTLPLAERVARLYTGCEDPIAAFSSDGTLLFATPGGRRRLGSATTIAALSAGALAAKALAAGQSAGETAVGPAVFDRIGDAIETIVIATFSESVAAWGPAWPDAPAVAGIPPYRGNRVGDRAIDEFAMSTTTTSDDSAAGTTDALAGAPVELTAEKSPVPWRHPLRFIWQMDAQGCFTLGSDEFMDIIGPKAVLTLGRPWNEINAELGLDPAGHVARAIATRDTWSGVTVSWPVDGAAERLTVELSGLPVYDGHRAFQGYRGFGVCRDLNRLSSLAQSRQLSASQREIPSSEPANRAPTSETPPSDQPEARLPEAATPSDEAAKQAQEERPETQSSPATPVAAERPILTLVPPAKNVVPFRSAVEPRSPTLSAVEHKAFSELARQLTARLKGNGGEPAASQSESADRAAVVEPISLGTETTSARGAEAEVPSPVADDEPRETAKPETDGADLGGQDGAAPELRVSLHNSDAARNQDEQASAAGAELLAKTSHDIRAPLGTIVNLAETMLQERFGPIGNERYRGYLSDIRLAAGKVAALLSNMLELSRASAGTMQLGRVKIDLNEMVRRNVTHLQPQASRERVLIRAALAQTLPPICADAESVNQIVENLLTNSIQLADVGGQIIISTTNPDPGRVVLRLRDTGTGAGARASAPSLSAQAASDAATRDATDAELEYPLARALVEANGATLTVSKRNDDSTLVEIVFPAAPAISA